jgi:hypothetical protein
MPNVYVDVELDDFDDKDLIRELECRGYEIAGIGNNPDMNDVIWRYKCGYIKDALLILERLYPELYGISKLVGDK